MPTLVLESPNKVKKVQAFLDEIQPNFWRVVATVGHWRGLPRMDGQSFAESVSPRDWSENFQILRHDAASRLRSALKGADELYLAADPDREGEAIAWHVADYFNIGAARRVRFHEITKTAVQQAIAEPGEIDQGLVEAQRSRAVIDYLLGLELSRMLWRFGAKSAGRVQSCALRILVEREYAIREFRVEPFWTLHAEYKEGFKATIATMQKPEGEGSAGEAQDPVFTPTRFKSLATALEFVAEAEGVPHVVDRVVEKTSTKRPPAPFTTASLLAAASDIGIKPARATKFAQVLFEEGFVTYPRTDSVSLSAEAVTDVRAYLGQHHPDLLPDKPNVYSDRSTAQGAHEAIRPTAMSTTKPEGIAGEAQKLYQLIWHRTLNCQAKPATLSKTAIYIRAGEALWRFLVSGTTVVDPGFLSLPGNEQGKQQKEPQALPPVEEGQVLAVDEVFWKKGMTKPPSRFTARSLIKYLERKGIGRPSTYSSIFSTLLDRGYVAEEKSKLVPQDLGFLTDKLLRLSFSELTREDFTAKTEAMLDQIERGELRRVDFLEKFYERFLKLHAAAKEAFTEFAKANPEYDRQAVVEHDKPCPVCQGTMRVINGKYGKFAQCLDENCGKTVDLKELERHKTPCPDCGEPVIIQPYSKEGRARRFFRCSSCDWRSGFEPPRRSKYSCHVDESHGPMFEHVFKKRGKPPTTVYVCATCQHRTFTGPKPPDCPGCGQPMRLRKTTKAGKGADRTHAEEFWGCSGFPKCRCTLPVDEGKGRATKPRSSRRTSRASKRGGRSVALVEKTI